MYHKKAFFIIAVFFLSACSSVSQQATSSDVAQQDLAYKIYKENLTRHNPRAAVINVQLAMGYLEQGNTQQAKHKIELAMQQDKNSSLVMGGMAYFLEKTGEPEAADTYYRAAIKLAQNKGEANNNYGAFLCRKKQYTQAIQYFLMAVADQRYTTPGEAYENAGLCALKIPDQQLAAQYFRKALEKQPKLSTSLLELGAISYDTANYAAADKYLKQYNKFAEPTQRSVWLAERVSQGLNA